MSAEIIKIDENAVSQSVGFTSEAISKYKIELVHVNNYLNSISKNEDKQKAIKALESNPIYSHQKIAEYANVGLSIANRDYYIIPYGTRAEFPIDYKGLLKVAAIEARANGFQLIAKADTIKKGSAGSISISTNGLIDNIIVEDAKVNDEVVSAYAILALLDMETHKVIMQKVEALPVDEYSNAVKASKGGNVHKDYKTEMGKKIALRRAVKILATMFASDKLDKLFSLDNESYDMGVASAGDSKPKLFQDMNDLK